MGSHVRTGLVVAPHTRQYSQSCDDWMCVTDDATTLFTYVMLATARTFDWMAPRLTTHTPGHTHTQCARSEAVSGQQRTTPDDLRGMSAEILNIAARGALVCLCVYMAFRDGVASHELDRRDRCCVSTRAC